LPRDCGLLVVDSWLGMRVCDLAQAAGIALMEKFAIISGHDCDVPSVPRLSGVHVGEDIWSRRGVEQVLRLARSRPVPPGRYLIPVTGVNERESTSRIPGDDPQLGRAVRFIQDRADSILTVDDVADGIGVGRRALERRFRALLGRTVLDEIHRVHVDRAKRLLIETDLPLRAIAPRCGMSGQRQLQRLFARAEGISPGAFRQRHQNP
jgi:LacI family transcriptional regulator